MQKVICGFFFSFRWLILLLCILFLLFWGSKIIVTLLIFLMWHIVHCLIVSSVNFLDTVRQIDEYFHCLYSTIPFGRGKINKQWNLEYNEGRRDWRNLFAITSFCFFEVVSICFTITGGIYHSLYQGLWFPVSRNFYVRKIYVRK